MGKKVLIIVSIIVILMFVGLLGRFVFKYDFPKDNLQEDSNEESFLDNFVQSDGKYTLEEVYSFWNVSMCDELKDKSKISECRMTIAGCVSELLNSEELDECNFKRAFKEDNGVFCSEIVTEDLKNICSNYLGEDNSLRFNSRFLDRDENYCEKMYYEENEINFCLDGYNFIKRLNENNKVYCGNISNVLIKEECLK